ncbi:hypothetical protein HPP92_018287 [Vanilla planifolia]|uniref:Uncharacterized protein n=1 Tax=Vanilla planifolia TaxID=51239 RepID=A0A835QFA8_VANPL|nr:hypothetical protein HPP92_018287 [Vanilla planifolia]
MRRRNLTRAKLARAGPRSVRRDKVKQPPPPPLTTAEDGTQSRPKQARKAAGGAEANPDEAADAHSRALQSLRRAALSRELVASEEKLPLLHILLRQQKPHPDRGGRHQRREKELQTGDPAGDAHVRKHKKGM